MVLKLLVLGPEASALPVKLREVQILRPHLRPPQLETPEECLATCF